MGRTLWLLFLRPRLARQRSPLCNWVACRLGIRPARVPGGDEGAARSVDVLAWGHAMATRHDRRPRSPAHRHSRLLGRGARIVGRCFVVSTPWAEELRAAGSARPTSTSRRSMGPYVCTWTWRPRASVRPEAALSSCARCPWLSTIAGSRCGHRGLAFCVVASAEHEVPKPVSWPDAIAPSTSIMICATVR